MNTTCTCPALFSNHTTNGFACSPSEQWKAPVIPEPVYNGPFTESDEEKREREEKEVRQEIVKLRDSNGTYTGPVSDNQGFRPDQLIHKKVMVFIGAPTLTIYSIKERLDKEHIIERFRYFIGKSEASPGEWNWAYKINEDKELASFIFYTEPKFAKQDIVISNSENKTLSTESPREKQKRVAALFSPTPEEIERYECQYGRHFSDDVKEAMNSCFGKSIQSAKPKVDSELVWANIDVLVENLPWVYNIGAGTSHLLTDGVLSLEQVQIEILHDSYHEKVKYVKYLITDNLKA